MKTALAGGVGVRSCTLLLALLLAVPAAAQEVTATSSTADTESGESPASSTTGSATDQEKTDDDDTVWIEWRDGLRATSADGRFQLRIGGRIHLDAAFLDEGSSFDGRVAPVDDAVEIRRVRVDFRGHVYDRFQYRAQIDFAGGEATAKDVWLGIGGLPTTLRFGHLKEPFSLEEITSSNYTLFVERSLMNVLAPSRNVGAYASGSFRDDRIHWAAGVFRDTDGFGAGAGTANFTGRLTASPLRSADGRRLLHVGAGLTHKQLDGALRLRVRPEVHLAPRVLDATVPADSADYLGVELGGNVGPLNLSAEYTRASFDAPGDPSVDGFYVAAGYFLTGESRPYSGTAWQRVRPRRNFLDGSGGPGAVMVGARYSRIDLGEVVPDPAGEMSGLTLGVNWHWNPSTRLMLNWVRSELDGADEASMLSLRMQLNL